MTRRPVAATFLLLLTLILPAHAADLGEGTDLEIGGPGRGKGKFQQVTDLAFDAKNRLAGWTSFISFSIEVPDQKAPKIIKRQ